jgi:organic hydroperoxide reductase OsmC/OhrA
MIELVWDAERLGTATAPSGATASVGERPHASGASARAHFSPDDLVAMAVSSCVMRTFLRLAEQANVPILSYASTARAESACEPGGTPHVTVHAYVVAPSGTNQRDVTALFRKSARLSPITQLLGEHVTVTTEVQALCGTEPAAG